MARKRRRLRLDKDARDTCSYLLGAGLLVFGAWRRDPATLTAGVTLVGAPIVMGRDEKDGG